MDSINLEVVFLDGTKREVEIIAGDIVAFEEKFEKSIDEVGLMTHFYFLAWHSLKRIGETAKGFEEWVSDIRGVAVSDPKGL
jgi:hypothetical protein